MEYKQCSLICEGRGWHHIHFSHRAKSEMSPGPTQASLLPPGLFFLSAEGHHSVLCLVQPTYVSEGEVNGGLPRLRISLLKWPPCDFAQEWNMVSVSQTCKLLKPSVLIPPLSSLCKGTLTAHFRCGSKTVFGLSQLDICRVSWTRDWIFGSLFYKQKIMRGNDWVC